MRVCDDSALWTAQTTGAPLDLDTGLAAGSLPAFIARQATAHRRLLDARAKQVQDLLATALAPDRPLEASQAAAAGPSQAAAAGPSQPAAAPGQAGGGGEGGEHVMEAVRRVLDDGGNIDLMEGTGVAAAVWEAVHGGDMEVRSAVGTARGAAFLMAHGIREDVVQRLAAYDGLLRLLEGDVEAAEDLRGRQDSPGELAAWIQDEWGDFLAGVDDPEDLPLHAIRTAPELQPAPQELDPTATEEAMAALPQDLEMVATWQGADGGALTKALQHQRQLRKAKIKWTSRDEAVLVRIYEQTLGADWYMHVGSGKHHKKVQATVAAETGRSDNSVRQKVNIMAKSIRNARVAEQQAADGH